MQKLRMTRWKIRFKNFYGEPEVSTVFASTKEAALNVLGGRLHTLLEISQDKVIAYYG